MGVLEKQKGSYEVNSDKGCGTCRSTQAQFSNVSGRASIDLLSLGPGAADSSLVSCSAQTENNLGREHSMTVHS